jgi:hypothetical protein
MFMETKHWTLTWVIWYQSTFWRTVCLKSISVQYYYNISLCLGFWSAPLECTDENFVFIYYLTQFASNEIFVNTVVFVIRCFGQSRKKIVSNSAIVFPTCKEMAFEVCHGLNHQYWRSWRSSSAAIVSGSFRTICDVTWCLLSAVQPSTVHGGKGRSYDVFIYSKRGFLQIYWIYLCV